MQGKDDGRTVKTLTLVNSAKDPTKKQYSIAVFEDKEGNKYEYSFSANADEKSRNAFYRAIAPFAYLPVLQDKKNKKYIKVRFRQGKMRLNPITGKYIYQMLYPFFEEEA